MKKATNTRSKGTESVFSGSLRIPGTTQETAVNLTVGLDNKSVGLSFSDPEIENVSFQIAAITVRNLLKYDELHFITSGLPLGGVDLQWKTNIARADNTVAGVIIARANKHKVVGEVGFSLVRTK
tara:strand:+ start:2488 stop:2862 length:375 start_codon:yes stop_codon:yes gene_type:complete